MKTINVDDAVFAVLDRLGKALGASQHSAGHLNKAIRFVLELDLPDDRPPCTCAEDDDLLCPRHELTEQQWANDARNQKRT